MRSRSQSQGDEQIEEVQEEVKAEGGGQERGREGEYVQGGRSERGSELDREKEHQEDVVEKEEDLHQRSVSETDLR